MNANKRKIATLIIWLGPLVSLAVSPSTNLDPINLIKILILSTIAFGIIGLITKKDFTYIVEDKSVFFSIIFFIIALGLPLLFSGAPLNQQIWGSWGRNTGFLTYFALLTIFVGAFLIQDINSYRSINQSLLIAGIPMSSYCLIQIAKLDPVSWSLHETFGTLGNINFLSAFLGLVIIAQFCFVLDQTRGKSSRIFYGVKIVVDFLIIYSTNSIQGIMIAVAGIGVAVLAITWKIESLKKFTLPLMGLGLFGLISTILGLMNKGFLAKFVFQPSVLYRADYMHAGWEMTLKRPLYGVGLDSYGDWYRLARGQISTLRTGPDRISNSAHNIFLDISSGGGFTLLIAYLLILFLVLKISVKFYRDSEKLDFTFLSLFTCWFAYQIQALVSINQVGVGIWGWILSGSLLGYGKKFYSPQNINKNRISGERVLKGKKIKTLSPATSIRALLIALIGFIFALIPFMADAKYRNAMNSRNIQNIVQSLDSPGVTAFHLENALQTLIQNNAVKESSEIAHKLVAKYPLDYYGWRMIALLNSTPEPEKQSAIMKLKELDPFNPDIG